MVIPILFPVVFTKKAVPTSLSGTKFDKRVNIAGQVMVQRPNAKEFNPSMILQSSIKCHDANRKGIKTITDSNVRFLPYLSARAPLGSIKAVDINPPILKTRAFSAADAPRSDRNNGKRGVMS